MQNDNLEPLFLSSCNVSKEAYRTIIESTVTAIIDSLQDEKAYRGMTPQQLQKEISSQTLLPEQGLGFPSVLDSVSKSIIPNFLRTSSTDYMAHLHSPALLESIASELILSTFNQSMDSWDQSPIATEVEMEVIRQLCTMYDLGDQSDGVFTSGGSQSNLSGITLARDWYCNEKLHHDVKKEGLPSCYSKFRIYTSEVSHFSMEKSAHLLGLGYNAVVKVTVDAQCKMDSKDLERRIAQDRQQGYIPIAVIATIGTTDYGSIDPIDEISAVCKKEGLWLHGDAAYGSGVILSSKYAHRIASIHLCDSLTVDFHKMFLLPISCGAFLVKEGKHLEAFTLHADYLNREEDEEDGYTNLVGKSLQTTRRFDALKVWMAFQVRGKDGYAAIIDTCIENAAYVYEKLSQDDTFEVAIKPEISSIVFRLKASCEVNKRVRRNLIHSQGVVIGQTVYQDKTYLKFTLLNPAITHGKLDSLLSLIKELGEQA